VTRLKPKNSIFNSHIYKSNAVYHSTVSSAISYRDQNVHW